MRHFPALILAAMLAACAAHPETSKPEHAAAPALALPALFGRTLPPIEEASVAQLQGWMTDGTLNAHALVAFYLERIDHIDRGEHGLHAIIELNPAALAAADALDAERAAGHVRGPLHGIPVLLKDNIATRGSGDDGMETTAGSLALVGHRAPKDAFLVEHLRAAGAIILGKTNLSEWANWRSTLSSSGWSGRGGQTRNPYDLTRNPCGSSSGSGAAIAANLAALAVGSETDGSIVCPSSVNGLVGIKPTLGRISRSGIIPIAASQDTAGPMARSVRDAALLLDVLAGRDDADPATRALAGARGAECFSCGLDDTAAAGALKGVRVGVLRKLGDVHADVAARLDEAVAALKAQGAVIVDALELPNAGKYDDDETAVLTYEFKDGIAKYLAPLDAGAPKSLADLMAFNTRESAREMPLFGQELFQKSQDSGPLTTPAYRKARARSLRLAGRDGIDALMKKQHLDVLVAPTIGPASRIDYVNGDHWLGGSISSAPAVAGYPHLTVPMGTVRGLPVGLSFVGPAWSEVRLIRYGYAYEQATHRRQPPPANPVAIP